MTVEGGQPLLHRGLQLSKKMHAATVGVCNGDVISRVGYGSIDAVPHMGFVCVLYRLFS